MSNSSLDADQEVVTDEVIAESSTADDETGAKPPESMLDAVMASVKVEVEPTPPPAVEKDEEGVTAESETSDDVDPPFHEHPRWKQLIGKNRELENRAKVVDDLESNIHEAGLEMTDVDQGIELMRLLKHEPEKALEALAPVIQQLQRFNGQGDLPENLQADVDAGRITEEYAHQLAKEQTRSEFYRSQTTQIRDRVATERTEAEQRAAEEATTQVKTSVDAWEEDWKAKDPDFDKKHRRVRERVLALTMEEGHPTTPEGALAVAKRALKEVNDEIKALLPPKPSSRNVTGGSSVKTAPQPASLAEAIANAVNGA